MTKDLRVCVVGAGPAGLIATKTLRQAGLTVDCFETSPYVGGQWVLDNPSGRSAVYRSITTNTSRRMSRLSDFDMPSDWPDFPSHEQVRAWWESYVDHFDFRDALSLGVEVEAAEPLEPSGWRVSLREVETGRPREERFDALLACSGCYWSPRTPEIPGAFDGAILHSQRYRDPTSPIAVAGQRVVVVGIGNTGCEIACEMAEAGAESVFLSARSGTWILPKLANGRPAADGAPMLHPTDPVPAFFRLLPARMRERLFQSLGSAMFHRRFGERMQRFEALGLPPPPASPFEKRPTVSEPLLAALEAKQVLARPGIERYAGSDVVFSDGRVERADVVVHATGYELRYAYLSDEFLDPGGEDFTLFLGTLHPRRADLFIVGLSRPTGAFWPIAEVHAQLAASVLSGRCRLPQPAVLRARARPVLSGQSINPALYALAVREEIKRGERRA